MSAITRNCNMQFLRKEAIWIWNSRFKEIRGSFSTKAKTQTLEEHKQKLMARGLPKVKPIAGVKHILMVASGKGGVGKSTTAVNLAACLKLMNPSKNIGLLDTDVFGPSVPLMMNLHDTPLLTNNNLMKPLINYGVQCMSMGFLVAEDAAVIWRGLMVMQALEKLMRQVAWDNVDYLIVDTPPGTGDTHLTIVQNIPITGTILVTTPQSAAIQVTKRGISMLQKLNIPIIGIVENMSTVKCPNCTTKVRLFGADTSTLSAETGIRMLGHMPLQQDISNCTDEGVPIVISKPKSEETTVYKNLCEKITYFINKSENT